VWYWMRRSLFGLAGLLIIGAVAGAIYEQVATRRELAATPPPGQLVDVGGHRLHIWCTGAGTPRVILETGLGGSSVDWGFVQPEVARFTRVCSYDRAGMGYSDPGPSPRTARRIAAELAALLDRSGESGPLVLVGASSGGFSMRIFASEHVDRVNGLVLVDASHEDQAHTIPSVAPVVPVLASLGALRLFGVSFGRSPESLAPPVREYARATRFRASGYRTAASEILNIRESANEVRTSRRKLASPVVVVMGARGADATWRALQRDQAELSPRGCLVVAEQSSHVVPIDQPHAVVDAIRATVEVARGRNDVPLCGATTGARHHVR
jgi:pimeloyl-ACP methyl ester carboxylesterase